MNRTIILVSESFYPTINGVSYVVNFLKDCIEKQNSNVIVVTSATKDRKQMSKIRNIIEINTFEKIFHLPLYIPSNINRILSTVQESIVHFHNIHSLFVPRIYKAINGIIKSNNKIVFSPHFGGKFFTIESDLSISFAKILYRDIIKNSSKIIFASEYEKQMFFRHFYYNKDKSVVINHPVLNDVPLRSWKPPEDSFVILYAGRLDRYKHPEIVLQAGYLLAKKIPNVNITIKIIGSGPLFNYITRYAKGIHQPNLNIVFKKFLPRKEYLEELKRSSVLILPSEGEAYGIVIAESLGIGLPVIIPKTWGFIYKKYPRAILYGEHYDIYSLIKKLIWLYKKMTSGSLLELLRYKKPPTQKEVCDEYVRVYQHV